MRLDKFLKVSRLIKRRTVAKDICVGGKAEVNGRVAKASTEVNVGDIISLRFGDKLTSVEVLIIKENVRANEASELYKLINR